MVLFQKLLIDTGLVVEPLGVRDRREFHQIPITLFVSRKQDEMEILVFILRPGAIRPGARGHVKFAAHYGVYCGPARRQGVILAAPAGFYKLQNPKHVAVVRDCQMFHPQSGGLGCQSFYRGGAVQQGEIGMDVEVNKIGHTLNFTINRVKGEGGQG
jgi:hypothetical protein